MNLYMEIAVMVSVFCACWCGLALAKAAHQREGAEVEAFYSDPGRPRRAVHGPVPRVGSMAPRASAAELKSRISRRSMEVADRRREMHPPHVADCQSQVSVMPPDAA